MVPVRCSVVVYQGWSRLNRWNCSRGVMFAWATFPRFTIHAAETYFICGRMMPRKIIFWQKRKTRSTGIEVTTKAAITVNGCPPCV